MKIVLFLKALFLIGRVHLLGERREAEGGRLPTESVSQNFAAAPGAK